MNNKLQTQVTNTHIEAKGRVFFFFFFFFSTHRVSQIHNTSNTVVVDTHLESEVSEFQRCTRLSEWDSVSLEHRQVLNISFILRA